MASFFLEREGTVAARSGDYYAGGGPMIAGGGESPGAMPD